MNANRMKPVPLDEKKMSKPKLTDVDISQWQEVICANIRADDDMKGFYTAQWGKAKVENRGLTENVNIQLPKLEKMITFVATYAPATLFREITQRCESLKAVWLVIRKWAGIRPSSSQQLTYTRLKNSYDPSGSLSHEDFYYTLKDAKEQCLITKDSGIKYDKKALEADEELGPCIESDVVIDWLTAIHSHALVEVVFKNFAKELESSSLADLQERISHNLPTLIAEADNTTDGASASIGKAFIRDRRNTGRGGYQNRSDRYEKTQDRRDYRPRFDDRRQSSRGRGRSQSQPAQFKPCTICKARGLPQANNHTIATCYSLDSSDRKQIVGIHKAYRDGDSENDDDDGYDHETQQEGQYLDDSQDDLDRE